MSQPNFLQIRTSLARAIALCRETPALRSSAHYLPRLERALSSFDDATRRTDATYTAWRELVGLELKAFRTARLDWDRVVALCDEHALDGVPTRRLAYTERDLILALLDETATFLEARATSWEWVPTWAARLRGHIDAAHQARRRSEDRYLEYTEFVKSRITAFEDARSLITEYVRDAAADHRGTPALEPVRFDLL